MSRKQKQKNSVSDVAWENFFRAEMILDGHPIFSPLMARVEIVRQQDNRCPRDGWALVTRDGHIHVHPTRRGEPAEWVYVLAHCLLHLGFGQFREGVREREWNNACCLFAARFLADLKLGRAPEDLAVTLDFAAQTEERLYEGLLRSGKGAGEALGMAGPRVMDMVWGPERLNHDGTPFDWQECFGQGLVEAVAEAVAAAGGEDAGRPRYKGPGERARAWFVDNYPLLGALAAGFEIVENTSICQRMEISVAAVAPESREIFINPAAGLDEQELRFVMAHELLHVGLRHDTRRQGRDAFLWNVSCDYVINSWLVEMRVGVIPHMGLLYDESLKGMSAEAIYDMIVTDARRFRRLATLRGVGLGDILEPRSPGWWESAQGCDLDEFYRRALAQGLSYHHNAGRGYLPEGLIEEIRALSVPPIPWDVELAQWFDDHFPPIEMRRTYARASRRQSATPDIPRPNWAPPIDELNARTFGVVLDTSGSMDRVLLAKALGAIASYSVARDVPAARVVFCDAAAYDQGYMPPEDIAGRVKVRGRGGTVLQPGVELLEKAEDFPKDGPLLIITDGICDRFHVHREHAFLMPEGRSLPFVPRGRVFRIK